MFSRREIMLNKMKSRLSAAKAGYAGKVYRFLIVVPILITLIVVMTSGCEYDVAEPQWDKTGFSLPESSPAINSINPPEGVAGVNVITIVGENFDLVPNSNILLDIPKVVVISPEIVEKTPTSITIRRPNLVTDSLFVKVWGDSGLVEKFGPYKIDPVLEQYGSFLENQQLGALAVDNAENLYVAISITPFTINKVTPDGQKTIFKDTLPSPPAVAPTDVKIGTDGSLYILRSNRLIQRANPTTGEVSSWHNLRTNRQLRVGDFDADGYFYAGGSRTSLWVIAPDSTSEEKSDLYPASAGDTILAIHVHNEGATEYLYLMFASAAGRFIVRHLIGSGGSLGPQEVIVDFAQFLSPVPRDFAFASDGTIFISIDGVNPLITYNPGSGKFDYFYKNIVPPYVKQIKWGTGNYLYMISGNLSPAQNWTVYRVDMGMTAAP